jgi:hypothetical protein
LKPQLDATLQKRGTRCRRIKSASTPSQASSHSKCSSYSKSVLAVFKAQHTKENKRLLLHAKYPDASAFRSCPRFQPGFKTKRITTSDK